MYLDESWVPYTELILEFTSTGLFDEAIWARSGNVLVYVDYSPFESGNKGYIEFRTIGFSNEALAGGYHRICAQRIRPKSVSLPWIPQDNTCFGHQKNFVVTDVPGTYLYDIGWSESVDIGYVVERNGILNTRVGHPPTSISNRFGSHMLPYRAYKSETHQIEVRAGYVTRVEVALLQYRHEFIGDTNTFYIPFVVTVNEPEEGAPVIPANYRSK